MKCGKCGGTLGKSVAAHVTGVCPKCAGAPNGFGWSPQLIVPQFDNIPDFTIGQESTANWCTQSVTYYSPPATPVPLPPFVPFAEAEPIDPALEAIGRAFDDALDLAYLG